MIWREGGEVKFVLRPKGASMKLIAEYLERAADFEKMAVTEKDSTLKANLLKQAAAYRKLAEERAQRLNLTPLPRPPQSN
jgi:hypothetical protein